ncbi:hypothetical protein [Limosilactobacillus mucosae]|uniref:Uncharacterized protein n=1 Tax=Limosilactobacillus mucosae TaxID=97478 RepID=A0AAJ1M9Y4_LIMMU|nr:hypothetical protein [Limosilactobacillus mucosae]MDC2828419.1 hypothetical protein [Limosilactobacillus mucosae]MDC2834317.1 hypothetical protein [Limosilactobacillus mucosae]
METLKEVQRVLTTCLFNRDVMSLPNVSYSEIAKAAGPSRPTVDKDGNLAKGGTLDKKQVFRWVKSIRLDTTSIKNGVEPLSDETVGQWLVGNLSAEHLFNLYNWAKKEHFELQVNGQREKRKYLPEKQAAKKARQKNVEKNGIRQSAVAMASDFSSFSDFNSDLDDYSDEDAAVVAKKNTTKAVNKTASEDQKLRVEYVEEDDQGNPQFAYYIGKHEVTPGILGVRRLVDEGFFDKKDLDKIAMALFMSEPDVSNPKKLLINLEHVNVQQQLIISLLEYGAEANNPHDWTTHYVMESILSAEQEKLFSRCWITKKEHSGDDYVDTLLVARLRWDDYEKEKSNRELAAESKNFSLSLVRPSDEPNGKRNWIIVNKAEQDKKGE